MQTEELAASLDSATEEIKHLQSDLQAATQQSAANERQVLPDAMVTCQPAALHCAMRPSGCLAAHW